MEYRLDDFFEIEVNAATSRSVSDIEFQRIQWSLLNGVEYLRDSFFGADCCFIRIPPSDARSILLTIDGGYRIRAVSAGGWLLTTNEPGRPLYWIPFLPILRALDNDGHITKEIPISIKDIEVTATRLSVEVSASCTEFNLDLVVWQLAPGTADWESELDCLVSLERQPYFLYGSHTVYQRPADLYLHLIHGHVYENLYCWPKRWKMCDELDAYALYLMVTGLEKATGKRLYSLFKQQLIFSIIARQADDGGWYHGEWTDEMESHFRLHCGGMHLLAAAFQESGDTVIHDALKKAAAYISRQTDSTAPGTWFLHDSLERSIEGMHHSPFHWISSHALGKSPANMLVLNTHLDAIIALERYQQVTGDVHYQALLDSAREATRAVLALRPAEWLYRLLFRAVSLTHLPKAQAKALPLPARALKRLTWKYLMPRLHMVRAMFPRLVMPGGYIDRALTLRGASHQYQSVNLWDLVRYRRLLGEGLSDQDIETSLVYTHSNGIRGHWKETKHSHALGFWIEALYHLCLFSPEEKYRHWLAAAVVDADQAGLGLPPSVLGTNAETISPADRIPCPSPRDPRLRIINLCRDREIEFLAINPSEQPLILSWETGEDMMLAWQIGEKTYSDAEVKIPSHGFAWCRQSKEQFWEQDTILRTCVSA